MNKAVPTRIGEDEVIFGEIASSPGFLLRLAQVRVFDAFFDKLARHGLKPGEFTVLWVVGLNPGIPQGLLARKLRIKPAHMTKLVQRAVDAGRLTRRVPDDDRRSVLLTLTPEGARFVAEKRPEFLCYLPREAVALDAEEFETLIRLLRKFNGMEDAR